MRRWTPAALPVCALLCAVCALVSGCECGGSRACVIEQGRYFAFEPAGWDGSSALPLVVHYHGWNGSPENFYEDPATLEAYSEAGVLAIMPEGAEQTWTVDHMGLEDSGRDELAFLDALLVEVEERWPVDRERRYVTGHSLGASMAYTVACERGEIFAGAAPSSGGFWLPLPKDCPSPPIALCHIHGTDDPTWPYEGRTVTEGEATGTQASVDEDVAFWREHNQCGERTVQSGDEVLSCTHWTDCADGVEVGLCTHPGGHTPIEGWAARELAWLLRFRRSG